MTQPYPRFILRWTVGQSFIVIFLAKVLPTSNCAVDVQCACSNSIFYLLHQESNLTSYDLRVSSPTVIIQAYIHKPAHIMVLFKLKHLREYSVINRIFTFPVIISVFVRGKNIDHRLQVYIMFYG